MTNASDMNFLNYLIRRNDNLSEQQKLLLKQSSESNSLEMIFQKFNDVESRIVGVEDQIGE